MGLFYEKVQTGTNQAVAAAIESALETDPDKVDDVKAEAKERAADVAPVGYNQFKPGRFFGAVLLFAVIVAGGITTEALELDKSSDALWALSATVFGVVVGFLAGERSAA